MPVIFYIQYIISNIIISNQKSGIYQTKLVKTNRLHKLEEKKDFSNVNTE